MSSIIPDETRPNAEQVAEELRRMLYHNSAAAADEDMTDMDARAMSIPYAEFMSIAQKEKLTMAFYMNVMWAGWEIGLNIGFGCYNVVIATDSEHRIRWENADQPL